MSFFDKLKKGLQKTKNVMIKPFSSLFSSFRKVDEDLLEELEEILVCADVGAVTTEEIIDRLKYKLKRTKSRIPRMLRMSLKR